MTCTEIFEHLHQNPELSFEEFETTAFIRKILAQEGIEILDLPLKTGLVACIKGTKPGKKIAFRADIDALPLEEKTNLPYKSKNPGKMHACGHDIHMTVGIETITFNGWPVGHKDVASFLTAIATKLNELNPGTVDEKLLSRVIAEEEQYVNEYLDSLMGTFERHRFVIIGDSVKVLGILRFLVNIHGHIPLAAIFTDSDKSKSGRKNPEQNSYRN